MMPFIQPRPLLAVIALLACPLWSYAQTATVSPHGSFRMPGAVTALAFSADGGQLLAGDRHGTLSRWNVEQHEQIGTVSLPSAVFFAGFAGGDSTVVGIDKTGAVAVEAVVGTAPGGAFYTAHAPRRVALDAGTRYLAVATKKQRIALYDLRHRERIVTIDARDALSDILFLGFDRLGRQLIAISKRGEMASWNPVTGRLLRHLSLRGGTLHGSRAKVHAAATNRDAEVFIVGMEDVALPQGGLPGTRPGALARRDLLVAYDADTGIEITRIDYPGGEVERVVLGAAGDYAAVAGSRSTEVAFVDLRTGTWETTLDAGGRPTVLTLSEDGRRLAVGTRDGRVSVWTLNRRAPLAEDALDPALPSLAGRIRVLGETAPILAPDTTYTLAVLPFDDRRVSDEMAGLTVDILTTTLANIGHLRLVERLRIEALLAEYALQAQGLTEEDGLTIGKMLNADYVVLGSIGALGTTYSFTARLLNVETAEVVSGRQVVCDACRAQDLLDAIHLLSTTIAR